MNFDSLRKHCSFARPYHCKLTRRDRDAIAAATTRKR
jgi:hypothetical protein